MNPAGADRRRCAEHAGHPSGGAAGAPRRCRRRSFELLARRPDLQALRGYVTASLSVDAAKAAFYPHFDIKAFWGYNALSVGDLFKSSFQQINLLPGLYLPIFDGGRLNANLRRYAPPATS